MLKIYSPIIYFKLLLMLIILVYFKVKIPISEKFINFLLIKNELKFSSYQNWRNNKIFYAINSYLD